MSRLRVWKRMASLGLAILLAGTLSGCAKQIDCPSAKEGIRHCHKYTTTDGFKTCRISEDKTLYSGCSSKPLSWTNNIVDVTEDIEIMNALNLFRISDNIEELQKEIKNNVPHYQQNVSHTSWSFSGGSLKVSFEKVWEDIPKPEDPGTYQYVDYKYYACNIGRDDKGNPCIIKSPATADIFSIANEYPYFQLGSYYEEVAVSYNPPQPTR